jgi:phosphomannomutase
MIPWLLITEIMCRRDATLSSLVAERVAKFPASGEINRRVQDAEAVMRDVQSKYSSKALETDHVDGLSMAFDDWRFNLRASNTEPLLRLNVESRADLGLMQRKTTELLALIGGERG